MSKPSVAMILNSVPVSTSQRESSPGSSQQFYDNNLNNTLSSQSGQNFQPALVVTVVAVCALLPIIVLGLPNGADLWNHFRFALPFYDSIRSGTFYPGWLAESNDGWGDPRFRFYPPGLYYLLAAARMLSRDLSAGALASP